MKPPSTLEKKFMRLWKILSDDLPDPERELRFARPRRWAFDFAWPAYRVAVEIDGGTWMESGGCHQQPVRFAQDIEKLNAAVMLGWRVLRYTTIDLGQNMTGMIEQIEALLKQGKQVDLEEQRTLFGN